MEENNILEEIINLNGDCLVKGICTNCPFRKECLPSFTKEIKSRHTKLERLHLALNLLANKILLGDK